MADNTILQQGYFTGDGNLKRLALRSDVDFIHVRNITNIIAQTDTEGAEFFWQRDMNHGGGTGAGLQYLMSTVAGTTGYMRVAELASLTGFSLLDTSSSPVGSAIVATGTTNVVQPIISTGDTTGLADGDVVRLSGITEVPNLCSIDFEIDTINANTNFRWRYALKTAPGVAGTTNGYYRKIKYDPIFYPRRRYIVNIDTTAGQNITITTSVQHGLTAGQKVRFVIPAEYNITELNGVTATVQSAGLTASAFTVDINPDTTALTAMVFPTAVALRSPAEVIPFGEDTSYAVTNALDILADQTYNDSFIGLELAGGANSPAGSNNDVIYWVAGKSFSTTL